MQTKLLFLIVILCVGNDIMAQGQFAGAKPRTLIGKKYNNERVLPGMPGYEYRSVTIASEEKDPEQFSVGVFQKGNTWLVFYSVNDDTTSDKYTILDVLIIKHVTSVQSVRTLMCRQQKISDIEIVALTQEGGSDAAPAIKAWRFNRDKRRFEALDVKGVDCVNE